MPKSKDQVPQKVTVACQCCSQEKLTYSAQHKPYPCNNSTTEPSVPYQYINGFPMNDVYSGQQGGAPRPQFPYPCPCSVEPPPGAPPNDDLWDLQFCRWWGWNWIRKREEMLNYKPNDVRTKCINSSMSMEKKQKSKNKRMTKRDDFFTWWNKLLRKSKKTKTLERGEKNQLQNLYNTPCSSVAYPNPVNNCDGCSVQLKGNYKCYCSSSERTSTSSAIILKSKTRHQCNKQCKRERQSWIYEMTDTSSSEEFCPCMSVCPHKKECSVDENVEYLASRMDHLKSGCDEDVEYSMCGRVVKKQKKKCQENTCCCNCNYQSRCGYKKPKFVLLKQHNVVCSPPPDRCTSKKPLLKKVPRLQNPCRKQTATAVKPECIKFCKHKYTPETNCKYVNEYTLYCPCQAPPKKRIRVCKKQNKTHNCCCCCRCCCFNTRTQNQSQFQPTVEHYTVKTNQQVSGNYPQPNNVKDMNNNQFVSRAFGDGLYISPLSGKTYPLSSAVYTVHPLPNPRRLPKPLDINDKIFNFDVLKDTVADGEHSSLLNAICEAMLSSRLESKNFNQSCKVSLYESQALSPRDLINDRKDTLNKASSSTALEHNSVHKKFERCLKQENSHELQMHNYESDCIYNTKNDLLNLDNHLDTKLEITSINENKFNKSPYSFKTFLVSKKDGDTFKMTNAEGDNSKIQMKREVFEQSLFSCTDRNNILNAAKVSEDENLISKQDALVSTNFNQLSLNNSICEENINFKMAEQKVLSEQKGNKIYENDCMKLSFYSPQDCTNPQEQAQMSLTGLLSTVPNFKNMQNQKLLKNKCKLNMNRLRKERISKIFFTNNRMPISFTSNSISTNTNRPLVTHDVPPNTPINVKLEKSEEKLECIYFNKDNKPYDTTSDVIKERDIFSSEISTGTTSSCPNEILENKNKRITDITENNFLQQFPQEEKFTTAKHQDIIPSATPSCKQFRINSEEDPLLLQASKQDNKIFYNPNTEYIMKCRKPEEDQNASCSYNESLSSELSSLFSLPRESGGWSDDKGSIISEKVSSFNIIHQKSQSNAGNASSFKLKYNSIRKNERLEPDYFKGKILRKESPQISTICAFSSSRNASSKALDTLSKPEENTILSEQLPVRQKRW